MAKASGGVGALSYMFWSSDGAEVVGEQKGASSEWEWRPEAAGRFRVKAVVTDALGNRAETGWSEEYEVAPPLMVDAPIPDRISPQAAVATTIRWSARAGGGVGDRTFEFRITGDGGKEEVGKSGSVPEWAWTPSGAGTYRVRVIATDTLGNRAESESSGPYQVVPRLRVDPLRADRPAPQAAVTTAVRWEAAVTGGVGDRVYEFRLSDARNKETIVQSGPQPAWIWAPSEAGLFRVRVVVLDSLGNEAGAPWSEPYEIVPQLLMESLLPDPPAPRMATTMVRWRASGKGGVGERSYTFETDRGDGAAGITQSGSGAEWSWRPSNAGTYRVRAIVRDARGNKAESEWFPYEIAPPLRFESLRPDRPAPQAAVTAAIRWNAQASGGVGDRIYEFRVRDGKKESVGKSGPEAEWGWTPSEAGTYRVRVIVIDAQGNRAESAPSEPYRIEPKLEVSSLDASKPSPQTAGTALRWEANATGGVGARTFRFFWKDPSGRETLAWSGPEPAWEWTPQDPADYRVRVQVTDERGNTAERTWPSAYRVAPRVEVTSLGPVRPSPQPVTTSIFWHAAAVGGVGRLTYDFESRRIGGPQREEQSGAMPSWEWTPREPGRYEIRVLVQDSLGNAAATDWSQPYVVELPLIAVLPFENLSASPAPLKEIRASFLERLKKRGVNLLGEKELVSLMARHRVRYTGGVDQRVVDAFRKEAGVGGMLITSLALYMEQNPPKVALVSRLASTDARSTVTWADSVALAGDDAPGILGLGLVESMKELMPGALDRLADSLASHSTSGGHRASVSRSRGRFRPRSFFRSPNLREDKRYSIVLLPVVNHGDRKNAGELLAGVLIEQLSKAGGFEVLEPGMVRDELLKYRIVSPEGSSLDTADVLFGRLNVDLLLTGRVMDYDDARGSGEAPRVTFSVQVIERQSKEVVLASQSTNRGDDGVFFFGMGKLTTAHALASRMAAEAVERMLGTRPSHPKNGP